MSTLAQRLTVVFLVALPSGFLAEVLVGEIAAHRQGQAEAERRSALLRAAALGGQRSTRLDVDEILDVIRDTVAEMGFSEPQVFELFGTEPPTSHGPACPRIARRARHPARRSAPARRVGGAGQWQGHGLAARRPAARRPASGRARPEPAQFSTMFALPITTIDDALVVVTARWPGAGAPPASQAESLELFAAQAGASLRNAQVHQEQQAISDRLAHEASHDALTELPNRRRFTEQLERMCGRGRAGDLIAVLFLDLDGFKDVNDRYGHDVGNDLLVAVASRLRSCVRPGDVVARMGGDEFTILLTRLESVAPAVEVAERIGTMMKEPFILTGNETRVSTSIGIARRAGRPAPTRPTSCGGPMSRCTAPSRRAKRAGRWTRVPWSPPPTARLPPAR